MLMLQHVIGLLNSLGSVLHALNDLVCEALILTAFYLELLWLATGFRTGAIFWTESLMVLQFTLLL